MPMQATSIRALRRLTVDGKARQAPRSECEFCSEPLGEPHEHVLEVGTGGLACSCTACALLFDRPGQERRRLPRDARALTDRLTDREWASLEIPVKLAMITVHSSGVVSVGYPGPGGVARAVVAPEAWTAISTAHAALQEMQADLECLVINRMEAAEQLFVTPLDQAYRLAGLVRRHWQGVSGGPEVRRQVQGFCAPLRRRRADA
jgi:hypothetical protein